METPMAQLPSERDLLHRIACALEEIRDELIEQSRFKKENLKKLYTKLDKWEKKINGGA